VRLKQWRTCLQVQSPEFKPQSCQKRIIIFPSKGKRNESWDTWSDQDYDTYLRNCTLKHFHILWGWYFKSKSSEQNPEFPQILNCPENLSWLVVVRMRRRACQNHLRTFCKPHPSPSAHKILVRLYSGKVSLSTQHPDLTVLEIMSYWHWLSCFSIS
jgi:hypothetical protein